MESVGVKHINHYPEELVVGRSTRWHRQYEIPGTTPRRGVTAKRTSEQALPRDAVNLRDQDHGAAWDGR